MRTVIITGWEAGFLKVSHSMLLQEAAAMSLSEAKAATDSVLEGMPVSIPVATEVEAESLVMRLRQLKAVAHVA